MAKQSVWIVGCGAVGSRVAYDLAMSFNHFLLWDKGEVRPENLSASVYGDRDVGKQKARALELLLLARNCTSSVTTIFTPVTQSRLAHTLATEGKPVLIVECLDNIKPKRIVSNIEDVEIIHTHLSPQAEQILCWWDDDWPADRIMLLKAPHTYLLSQRQIRMAAHMALSAIESYLNYGYKLTTDYQSKAI